MRERLEERYERGRAKWEGEFGQPAMSKLKPPGKPTERPRGRIGLKSGAADGEFYDERDYTFVTHKKLVVGQTYALRLGDHNVTVTVVSIDRGVITCDVEEPAT